LGGSSCRKLKVSIPSLSSLPQCPIPHFPVPLEEPCWPYQCAGRMAIHFKISKDRNSVILSFWAGPGAPETLSTGGGEAPRLLEEFPGRPDIKTTEFRPSKQPNSDQSTATDRSTRWCGAARALQSCGWRELFLGGLPKIDSFRGLNGPLLPQNLLEQVGGFASHLLQWVLREEGPFGPLKLPIFGRPPLSKYVPIKDPPEGPYCLSILDH